MEAAYAVPLEGGKVRCDLCPNECIIADGHWGACSVRGNHGGVLIADAYGKAVSLSLDPVEKKPLYHFYPSRPILSTGPNGCNFRCGFCQNSEISQDRATVFDLAPLKLAEAASEDGSIGVAYTYSEPFVWFEYIRDAGALIHERGLVNVLVTNGYVNERPLRELLPLIDAMNVDIKSMRQEFYTKVCGGKLDDVLRTVEIAAPHCHIELTNLIIPGYNDTDDDFDRLVDWVLSVNPAIPLHFSRYYPRYRFTAPETPRETLFRAFEKAKSRLRYVYMGNVPYSGVSDTLCHNCGNLLVARSHYEVKIVGVRDGSCANCGVEAEIVGLKP
jgi:pyruvate formate lyase activating enzyme